MMGSPNAGKGTQADLIAKGKGWAHFSSGDMARKFATPEQRARMDAGELLSDEEIFGWVAAALGEATVSCVLLDGFPRRASQVDLLVEAAKTRHWKLAGVIDLVVDDKDVMERARLRAEQAVREHKVPRPDDDPRVVRERLAIFHEEHDPTMVRLGQLDVPIYQFDGRGGKADIHFAIVDRLGLARNTDADAD